MKQFDDDVPPGVDFLSEAAARKWAADAEGKLASRINFFAAFVQARVLQSRPVRNDTAAFQRAAHKQRDRGRAVVGAVGAVDARGAAELGRDHDDGVAPVIAEAAFEFGERTR